MTILIGHQLSAGYFCPYLQIIHDMDTKTDAKECHSAHGENLVKRVQELIAEGNIRKITIADRAGKELMSFPLTVGVVGALLAPVLAAVGAMAALIGECSITVEREPAAEDEYDHMN